MASKINYLAYCQINGYKIVVHVPADKPEEVVEIVKEIFAEIESKVESIRIADEASGFFLRGFS